jgi:hypothetical protein
MLNLKRHPINFMHKVIIMLRYQRNPIYQKLTSTQAPEMAKGKCENTTLPAQIGALSLALAKICMKCVHLFKRIVTSVCKNFV